LYGHFLRIVGSSWIWWCCIK